MESCAVFKSLIQAFADLRHHQVMMMPYLKYAAKGQYLTSKVNLLEGLFLLHTFDKAKTLFYNIANAFFHRGRKFICDVKKDAFLISGSLTCILCWPLFCPLFLRGLRGCGNNSSTSDAKKLVHLPPKRSYLSICGNSFRLIVNRTIS